MLWLYIMDSANVFVLLGQFPEPRTSFYVIMGYRADPNVVYKTVSNLNGINPL